MINVATTLTTSENQCHAVGRYFYSTKDICLAYPIAPWTSVPPGKGHGDVISHLKGAEGMSVCLRVTSVPADVPGTR